MLQKTWLDRPGQLILRGQLQTAGGSGFHSFRHAG
jgi:hypothetical protein